MITQAIKGWLQKLFAWRPWKQSTPIEYQHVASVVTRGPTTETTSWPQREGTAPQSGASPCLSTLEDQPEATVLSRFEVPDAPPSTALSLNKEKEQLVGDAGEILSGSPTNWQRLAFLRYLVQQGIVNEGFEKKEADS